MQCVPIRKADRSELTPFFEIESKEADTKESILFDYIDSLLQSVSREYEIQRHQIWVQKLEGLLSLTK